jgi:hypothetical protein
MGGNVTRLKRWKAVLTNLEENSLHNMTNKSEKAINHPILPLIWTTLNT